MYVICNITYANYKMKRYVYVKERTFMETVWELLSGAALAIFILGFVALLGGILGFSIIGGSLMWWVDMPKDIVRILSVEGPVSVIKYQWDLFACIYVAYKGIRTYFHTYDKDVSYAIIVIGLAIVKLLRAIENMYIFQKDFGYVIGQTLEGTIGLMIAPLLIIWLINRIYFRDTK